MVEWRTIMKEAKRKEAAGNVHFTFCQLLIEHFK